MFIKIHNTVFNANSIKYVAAAFEVSDDRIKLLIKDIHNEEFNLSFNFSYYRITPEHKNLFLDILEKELNEKKVF